MRQRCKKCHNILVGKFDEDSSLKQTCRWLEYNLLKRTWKVQSVMMRTGCNGLGLVLGNVFHEHRFAPSIGYEVGQNPGQWPKDDDDEKLNLKEQLYFLNCWMAISFSNQINPCGIVCYVSLFCRILLSKVFSFHLLLQHDLQVHLPLHTHIHTHTSTHTCARTRTHTHTHTHTHTNTALWKTAISVSGGRGLLQFCNFNPPFRCH